MNTNRRMRRALGFAAVLFIALIAIVARLAQVQIAQGETFAAAARANQVRLIPVAAPRGLILDRHGVIIVRSRPSFVCALIPSEVADIDRTMTMLASVLRVDPKKLWHRLLNHRGVVYKSFGEVQTYEPNGPVLLVADLTPSQTARLEEMQGDLKGVDVEEQPVRNYPFRGAGSHMVGTVGAITEDEYAKLKGEGYSPNDVVGKEGLEATYDRYLRGRVGGQQIAVNAQGALVTRLQQVDPVPGNTLLTTIDWKLQASAEKNLRAELLKWGKLRGRRLSGAVVVIDPHNGGVLAMASYPNFDPNDFATPISEKRYSAYANDPLQPLYNRAIAAASPTGSTFKMVTGSGAISSGVIKPNQVLYDSGGWNCHGQPFTDLASGGLGTTDFVHALAASSDGYFYQLGDRLGNVRLRHYALQYGLDQRLGIDIRGEYDGNWPTEAWVQKTFGKDYHLEPSDACQLAIGQGSMQATPLQMANVTATVLNGGTLYRPHIVEAVRDPHGVIKVRFRPHVIRKVDVTAESLREVKAGMDQVTEPWGTAAGLAIPGMAFGGKTGTAETGVAGSGSNTTWFVAYAPAKKPVIAMAVYMEKTGGYGASVAAPVAQHIIADYFHKKIDPI